MSENKEGRFCLQGGTLWQLGRFSAERIAEAVFTEGADVHLALAPEMSLGDFEKRLFAAARARSLPRTLLSRIDGLSVLFISLGFSVVLSVLIGLVSLYEDLFKSLVVKGAFEEPGQMGWFLFCASLFVALVTFVPSLLSGEDSKVREWLHRWYTRSHRVQRRMGRLLRLLGSEQGSIHLWNPCAFAEQSWVWTELFEALKAQSAPCLLHVREGSRRAHRRIASQSHTLCCPLPSAVELGESSFASLRPLLHAEELLLLDLMLIFSTAGLPPAWLSRLGQDSAALDRALSLELVEALYERCRSLASEESAGTFSRRSLAALVDACRNDYGLIQEEQVKGHRIIKLSERLARPELLEDALERWPNLRQRVRQEALSYAGLDDPVGLLMLLGCCADEGEVALKHARLLDRLVAEIRRTEMYFLMHPFWALFGRQPQEPLFRRLNLESLKHLVVLFERSGRFEQALELARALQSVEGCRYRIAEGRLLERLGRYPEAFAIFTQDARLGRLRREASAHPELALSLLLQLSWAIVSGRLQEHRSAGRAALAEAQGLLDEQLGALSDPNMLWHFHNNRANYAEWEGDFEAAIAEHRRALELPGIELKWVSGSLVNLGIAYRLHFLQSRSSESLAQAMEQGFEGVRLKTLMGDRDELPVTLHNAALTVIEAQLAGEGPQVESRFAEALLCCERGLEILRRSTSTKRLGILLAERFLLQRQLAQEKADCVAASARELVCWLSAEDSDSSERLTVLELLGRAGVISGAQQWQQSMGAFCAASPFCT